MSSFVDPKSPLDPEIVAKGSMIACLAQGALATLGPKVSNSQYGLSDEINDDVQQYHVSNNRAQTKHLSSTIMYLLTRYMFVQFHALYLSNSYL